MSTDTVLIILTFAISGVSLACSIYLKGVSDGMRSMRPGQEYLEREKRRLQDKYARLQDRLQELDDA